MDKIEAQPRRLLHCPPTLLPSPILPQLLLSYLYIGYSNDHHIVFSVAAPGVGISVSASFPNLVRTVVFAKYCIWEEQWRIRCISAKVAATAMAAVTRPRLVWQHVLRQMASPWSNSSLLSSPVPVLAQEPVQACFRILGFAVQHESLRHHAEADDG